MASNWEILAASRLTAVLDELRNETEINADLRFLQRTPVRPATDEELMGRFRGDILISDIVMEGSRALIKNTDRFTTETWRIPKIKHGILIDEHILNLLNRINAGGGIASDRGLLTNYVLRKEASIVQGIDQRLNALVVAMLTDSFSYSRGGVIISNASWNVPAVFKSTVVTPWTSTTATPITDITTQAESDRINWGETRNRVTLSTKALNYIYATDEFKAKAQLFSQMTFPTGSFPLTVGQQFELLQRILAGFALEPEDARYWDQLDDGQIASAPYLPQNKVLLGNTADDNSEAASFIGNAIVPETQVAGFVQLPGVDFSGPREGPISYREANMNPPEVTLWGAQKAWPIRARQGMTSVMTVF